MLCYAVKPEEPWEHCRKNRKRYGIPDTVNIQKTSADVIPESARQNSSKAPPPKTAQPPSPSPPRPAPLAGSQWLAPTDRLSSAIVSFARFFSLPLKPELVAAIRRQAFAPAMLPQDQAQPANAEAPQAAARHREALSLAAAASLGKGAELSPKGLEAYAAAIDPGWEERIAFFERRGSGGQGRQRKQRDSRAVEARTGEKPAASPPDDTVSAQAIREAALGSEAGNPLLATLNRLPGKNGRRWVVFPFAFDKGGREFRVSMRVLLEENGPAGERASRMVLDVAECAAESDDLPGRWLFAVERRDDWAGLSVFVQPQQPPKAQAQLARELSRLMGIPAERISVHDYDGSFPCESPDEKNPLHTIDEAV